MSRRGRDLAPNDLLRAARLRLTSPTGSGRPMSRQELAEAINLYLWDTRHVRETLDGDDIGKLERGEHRWPGQLRREALRAILGTATDAELGLFINRQPAGVLDKSPSTALVADTDGFGGAVLDATAEGSDSDSSSTVVVMIDGQLRRVQIGRRSLLQAGSIGTLAPLTSWLPPDRSAPLDPAIVEHFDSLRALLVQADNRVGGYSVLPTVVQQVSLIGQFRRNARGRLHDRLLCAEARWLEFAGWLADDLGAPGGDVFLAAAADMAHESEDTDFSAYLFARKAQRNADTGAEDRVAGLAQVAVRTTVASAQVRAFALTQLAQGHAIKGDGAAFEACIDQSRAITSDVEPTPGDLGSFCTPHYVDMREGEGWLRLGVPHRAVDCFVRGAEAWPHNERRERAFCLMHAAVAQLQAGNCEQAATIGLNAWHLGRVTRSHRITARLKALADQIGRCRNSAQADQFIETVTAG